MAAAPGVGSAIAGAAGAGWNETKEAAGVVGDAVGAYVAPGSKGGADGDDVGWYVFTIGWEETVKLFSGTAFNLDLLFMIFPFASKIVCGAATSGVPAIL